MSGDMSDQVETDRARFEVWAREQGLNLRLYRWPGGEQMQPYRYATASTDTAWLAWRNALRLEREEGRTWN